MAPTQPAADAVVPSEGDHDRVAMLSLSKDLTPDQHNPEIIGDKEFAVAATQRQFRENAVSALDSAQLAERGRTDGAEELEQDPSIAERKKAHDKAAGAAEKAASKVVNQLHQG